MAGLPPTETCQWCGKPFPRVSIDSHQASCPENPVNKPKEK